VRDSITVPDFRPEEPKLRREQEELEVLRREREHLYRHIRAIESSKFWKIRQAWFGLKRRLSLQLPPRKEEQPRTKKSFFNVNFVLYPFKAEFSWWKDLRT
jgi:hypothetical protein